MEHGILFLFFLCFVIFSLVYLIAPISISKSKVKNNLDIDILVFCMSLFSMFYLAAPIEYREIIHKPIEILSERVQNTKVVENLKLYDEYEREIKECEREYNRD